MTAENDPTPSAYSQLLRALEEREVKAGDRYVLIADDEPSIRRMVSRSLKSTDPNLKVHEAENGEEALTALQTIRDRHGVDPILIITDLQMPVMDGWEFIDRLWEQCKAEGRTFGIPLIVLSASTGTKGILGSSVHGRKVKYTPLVTVAKEDCIKPVKYDTAGEKGLQTWVKHFVKAAGQS